MVGAVMESAPTSLVFLAVTFAAYRLALEPTGALLARREQRILDALIRDKE